MTIMLFNIDKTYEDGREVRNHVKILVIAT